MAEDDQRSFWNRWKTPILAAVSIYVVIRLYSNFASWGAPPAEAANAPDQSAAIAAGKNFAAVIVGQAAQRENQIQAMWRLIQAPAWHLPNDLVTTDAPGLAEEMSTRAQNQYAANNFPQAASYIKILLRWSELVLEASGGGGNHVQSSLGMALSKTALSTLGKCPYILVYPEIQKELDQLKAALENDPLNHIQREMTNDFPLDQPKAGKEVDFTLMERLFSNRLFLEEMLRDFLQGKMPLNERSRRINQLVLESWLLICPLDGIRFSRAVHSFDKYAVGQGELLKTLETTRKITPVMPIYMQAQPAYPQTTQQQQPAYAQPQATTVPSARTVPSTNTLLNGAPTPLPVATPIPTVPTAPAAPANVSPPFVPSAAPGAYAPPFVPSGTEAVPYVQ